MVERYVMKPEEFVGLWQLRGVRAHILDKSIVHGDTWVMLDRVTKTLAGFYGHLGSKQFEVGGYSSPALYTDIRGQVSDVDFSLLDNPLSDYGATQTVLEFINGNVTEQHSSETLYNLQFLSYNQPNVASLLDKISEEIGRGTDDGDKWVKVRAIQQALDLASNLATGAFQDAIEGVDELNTTIERLAGLVKGGK